MVSLMRDEGEEILQHYDSINIEDEEDKEEEEEEEQEEEEEEEEDLRKIGIIKI